jgi:hypothetical protein
VVVGLVGLEEDEEIFVCGCCEEVGWLLLLLLLLRVSGLIVVVKVVGVVALVVRDPEGCSSSSALVVVEVAGENSEKDLCLRITRDNVNAGIVFTICRELTPCS